MQEFIIPKQYNKTELKFFYYILSKLRYDKPEQIRITCLELYNICEKHRVDIDNIVIKLKSKDVAVIKIDGISKYLNIFDSIELHSGYWEINFDQRFINTLLELKSVSTEKALVMFGLNSIYSVKLYNKLTELDKLYLTKDELRELFSQSKTTQWAHIFNDILKPSVIEINKFSDIHIIMLNVVEKRHPTGFMFTVKQKALKNKAIEM